MRNEQWLAVYNVFEKMEQLCGNQQGSPVSDSGLTAPVPEEDISARQRHGTAGIPAGGMPEGVDVVRLRAQIRTQLDYLRAKLAETLVDRDCYLILFSIVARFDEYVQTRYLIEGNEIWPPLQKELFKIDDAGEIFYETLDDILRKPQTLPLVYEVFYFCLNHGFRGRYNDNPVKITEYLRRLRAKIPVHELENAQASHEEPSQIRHVGSMAWYYAAAGAAIVAGYFLFQAAANRWGTGPLFGGW